jgi:two-component system CheB/CheR fusion protein
MRKARGTKSETGVADQVGGAALTGIVTDQASQNGGFPIVGIGASAGGLEAFSQLLELLPDDTGMAFVFILHLDPTHPSFLAEALRRATRMRVIQAEDRARVEPNHVYVIPPNADVSIAGGNLVLVRRRAGGGPHLPVDYFLGALATERGSRAIGVILSGTASDGTEGLGAIKEAHGITLVQDPGTAKFAGMPSSAVAAGVADVCRPIPDLAVELLRLSKHPYVTVPERGPSDADAATLTKIFAIVKNALGVDFAEYKTPTLGRRIARRMVVVSARDLQEYLHVLERDPGEVRALHEDALIHVTSFFRDPEVFESVKKRVFPAILKNKPVGTPIRMWVAGCSNGEEVYSLAILLLEHLQDLPGTHPIQIFGSDVSEKAIERARAGEYPESAMRPVSEERRKRFFTRVEGGYRINKQVRDMCVFVRHDLARDPPFSKLDLASCRNVLIYFDQALQKRILPNFHYCLKQPGFLLLGRSETISGFGQLFSLVDKPHKIFVRTAVASLLHFAPRTETPATDRQARVRDPAAHLTAPVDVANHLDRIMLSRYAPPGVLVTDKLDVIEFRGQTGAFLQPAPGEPQNNLIKMARPGLLGPLRAGITRAKKAMTPVRKEAEVDQDGVARKCEVVVVPFPGMHRANDPLFLVLFEESVKPARVAKGRRPKSLQREPPLASKERRLAKLEHELTATKEYLQSLIEEHSQATEDLGSANEELLSGNEELQSMNEELETAKEELQSTNEELTTVNDELQSRNQEVSVINSDLINLLGTVDIPILILDLNHRIRRFTPKARGILNVVPSDVGRPFDDIRPNISVPELDAQITEVIQNIQVKETEVLDREGHWHRLQIRPYQRPDGTVDGAILSLVDIDTLKLSVAEAEEAKFQAERANFAKDEFLAMLSHELRTPLTTMLLQAQRIRRGSMDPTKLDRATEAIERGTLMLVQLIDDLLDVSRIVTNKMEMLLEEVDLAAVIKTAVEGVVAPAAEKAITLMVTLDETLGKIWGNSTRLQQVLTNLLTNAVKFTPEGGEVNVVLERANGRAVLHVRDNGRGIEPAFLPHVFRRFSQEDTSVTRAHGGLGLGLAIAHHLVELHGGTIRAESEGLGKGATFTVSLPLERTIRVYAGSGVPVAQPAQLPAATIDDDPIDLRRLADVRVLLVDDDSATREVVADMLEGTGAEVRVAESAAEGLAAVEDFRPGVVLCDIAMPGEDGYSFIRRMRALGTERGGGVPALALTALVGDEDRRRVLLAGFQMHVPKPVDINSLTRAVADLSHPERPPAPGDAPGPHV